MKMQGYCFKITESQLILIKDSLNSKTLKSEDTRYILNNITQSLLKGTTLGLTSLYYFFKDKMLSLNSYTESNDGEYHYYWYPLKDNNYLLIMKELKSNSTGFNVGGNIITNGGDVVGRDNINYYR